MRFTQGMLKESKSPPPDSRFGDDHRLEANPRLGTQLSLSPLSRQHLATIPPNMFRAFQSHHWKEKRRSRIAMIPQPGIPRNTFNGPPRPGRMFLFVSVSIRPIDFYRLPQLFYDLSFICPSLLKRTSNLPWPSAEGGTFAFVPSRLRWQERLQGIF